MVSETRIDDDLQALLEESSADETEALFRRTNRSLTRFANSEIHQNVNEENALVRLRVRVGRSMGTAGANSLEPVRWRQALERATRAAELAPEMEMEYGFPPPSPYPDVDCYDPQTAQTSPSKRARLVEEMTEATDERQVLSYGNLRTEKRDVVVVNSRGLYAETSLSEAQVNVSTIKGEKAFGYAGGSSRSLEELSVGEIARESAERCLKNDDPQPIEAGEYDVLLSEYAVADMVRFLGSVAFSGPAYEEGRSFVADNLGQKVVGENVDLWDDGTDPRGFCRPFDAEGTPKKKIWLVKEGVAEGVVYDGFTAQKYGRERTGHTLTRQGACRPTNLFLGTGEDSWEDIIAETEKALLITRFHYTRVAEPREVVITGMTRDGTFLVEGGEISHPVKNLRFTQSYRDAFKNVCRIGKRAKTVSGGGTTAHVPPLKIANFNFTGTTSF